jgi:hypothetical protein
MSLPGWLGVILIFFSGVMMPSKACFVAATLSFTCTLLPVRALGAGGDSDVPAGLKLLGPKEVTSSRSSSSENSSEGSSWKRFLSAAKAKIVPAEERPAPAPAPGPYSLVEWNAGDLLFRRGRLAAEYVVTHGVSLGFSSEYQSMENSTWANRTVAAGATVAQYFESLRLSGLFVRGEFDLFHSKFARRTTTKVEGYGLEDETKVDVDRGNTLGVMLGADIGHRFVLTRLLSTSLGLGVRRTVPEFFSSKLNASAGTYAQNEGLWQIRMNLGLALGI